MYRYLSSLLITSSSLNSRLLHCQPGHIEEGCFFYQFFHHRRTTFYVYLLILGLSFVALAGSIIQAHTLIDKLNSVVLYIGMQTPKTKAIHEMQRQLAISNAQLKELASKTNVFVSPPPANSDTTIKGMNWYIVSECYSLKFLLCCHFTVTCSCLMNFEEQRRHVTYIH